MMSGKDVEDILCVSKDSMLVAQALTTLAASARNPGERGLFITFNRIQIEFARAAREFPSDDIQLTVVVPGPGNTPEEAQKGAIVAKRLQQGQADTFLFAIIGYDPTGYSPLASDNSAIVFGNPALMPFERTLRLRQTYTSIAQAAPDGQQMLGPADFMAQAASGTVEWSKLFGEQTECQVIGGLGYS